MAWVMRCDGCGTVSDNYFLSFPWISADYDKSKFSIRIRESVKRELVFPVLPSAFSTLRREEIGQVSSAMHFCKVSCLLTYVEKKLTPTEGGEHVK